MGLDNPVTEPDGISIIIPAYNEEAAIGSVVSDLAEIYPGIELTVINDGSVDATADRAREAGAKVISHDSKRGYGAALHTGVLAANTEYVLFCDGDGQHSVEDVSRLMEARDGYDLVIGARDRNSHMPVFRRPGKFLIRKFTDYLAEEKIPDLNSGLRIVRRKTLLQYLHLMPQGFSFSSTSTFAFLKSNKLVKYVPITVRERIGSSTVRQWKHGPATLMLMLRLTVLFNPLKVFLTATAALFLLTLVSLGIDLTNTVGNGVSDTTVTLFISTLLVFMFGLLCDQVSALRREIHE